jgi:PmbA protein
MDLTQRLENLAGFVIGEAKRRGATDADVSIVVDQSVKIGVRMRDIEDTQGASDRSLTLRVFIGDKHAVVTTADFKKRSVSHLVRNAIVLAKASSADPSSGLPDAKFLAVDPPKLDLVATDIAKLKDSDKIQLAMQASAAVLAADPRVTNAEGNYSDSSYTYVYANTRGFCRGYSATNCSVVAQAVVKDGDEMRVGYWWDSGRSLSKIGDPVSIGQEAVKRAVRQLGARKVVSQQVPVVYDRQMAARLIGQLVGAANGHGVYRKSSFLAGKVGQQVASELVTIIDDPFMPEGHGSRPFGGEGLALSKRKIVDDGKLEMYLLDAYAARKLNTEPNGGGTTNLYLVPGDKSPESIIESVENGLYLTSISGPGFNSTTGDYSVGASGMWIENGKLAYPVSEITIASNVLEMFKGITAVGNDLEFRSSVCAPTILIDKMTVAGK